MVNTIDVACTPHVVHNTLLCLVKRYRILLYIRTYVCTKRSQCERHICEALLPLAQERLAATAVF